MKQTPIRRIVSALAAVAVLVTMLPATFAASASSFVDFPTGWSAAAMAFAVENGLINGKEDGRIEPGANLTRAEMAAIINRAFGAQTTADISAFSDVSSSEWYYAEMQKAVKMQTFTGDAEGTLRPNGNITREEVMTVLARALVLENPDFSPISNSFSDASSVSDWARPYISAIITNGYVNGYEDGTVRPLNLITREEFVQLIYNIFKTFITEQGSYYTVAENDCVMINAPGVILKDVTVDGDLVIGDGVGSGTVQLENITIKGRLLARGGNITLVNVTTGGGVVIKNVNGETHFNNYKTEAVFNGVRELTYTTYLTTGTVTPGGSTGGGGGGGGGGGSTYYAYSVNYYFQSATDDTVYNIDTSKTYTNSTIAGATVVAPTPSYAGYTYNASKSTASLVVTANVAANVLKVYYDIVKFNVKVTYPDGTFENKVFRYNQSPADLGIDMPSDYTDADGDYKVEWHFYDKNGADKGIITPAQKIAEDGDIRAVLMAKVEFDYNYEGAPQSTVIYVKKGSAPGNLFPTDPARTGYIFAGWNTKADGSGTAYTATSAIDKPLVLYAHWTTTPVTKHKVTFKYNDGTTADCVVEVADNAAVAPPVEPTRNGYDFKGWFTDESGTNEYDFGTPVTASIILYAKWELKTYTVTFVTQFATVSPQKVRHGEKAIEPSLSPRENYRFDGWFTEAAYTHKYDFNTPVTADITLYAKWTDITPPSPTKYTVTFDSDGGSAVAAQIIESGNKATKPTDDPIKAGYKFDGWYLESAEFDFNTPITSNITLKAKWLTVYTISYDAAGGIMPLTYRTEYTEKDLPLTLPLPTKTGYKFEGWSDETKIVKTITAADIGNKTYVAVWTLIIGPTFRVTFNSNGGSSVTEQIVEQGKTADMPIKPTKTGYTFDGWYTDNGTFNNEYDFNTPVTANTTLYAKWNINKYTVKFESNGGTSVADIEVDYNLMVAEPTTTWEGHNFLGWYTKDGTKFDFSTKITDDIVLHAKWEDIYYIVTFNFNNGSAADTKRVKYGDTVTEPENPTFGGKEFDGWYSDVTLNNRYNFSTPVKGNITLYAKWNDVVVPTKYTVNFYYNYIGAPEPFETVDNVTEGTEIGAPSSDPIRDYYDFDGWYANSECTNPVSFPYTVNGNTIIYAKWLVHDYSITYDLDGGVFNEEEPRTYNVESTFPISLTTPSKDGYRFTGWVDEDGNAVTEIAKADIAKGDRVFKATWEVKTAAYATLLFDYNDGVTTTKPQFEIEKGKSFADMSGLTWPVNPTRDNYDFIGWNTEPDGSGETFTKDTVVSDDITVYAKWEIKKFTVEFYIAAGTNRTKVGELADIASGTTIPYDDVYDLYNTFKNDPLKNRRGFYDRYFDGLSGYYDSVLDRTHMINAEYRYLDDNEKWQIFVASDGTNEDKATKISDNMTVEFTFKGTSADPSFKMFGIDITGITPYVPYSSTTRLFDSIKDGMTLSRNTVANGLREKDVEAKLYAKLASRGGLIDEEGNLLIKKFGLKIADVIDTSDIKKQVNTYLTNLIKGDRADLERVLDLIDIESLVNEIGPRNLIDALGYDGIRDAIKDSSNRAKLIDYIRRELVSDASLRDKLIKDDTFINSMLDTVDNPAGAIADELLTNDDLIIALLSSSVKNELIDKAAQNVDFMKELLSDAQFKKKVIAIVRDEKASELLNIINSSNGVKADIISLIKGDESFKNYINTNTAFRADITTVIKNDAALKNILNGNGNFKTEFISKIKTQTDYHSFRNKMIRGLVDDDFKIDVINRLKDNIDFRGEIIAALNATLGYDVSAMYNEYITKYVDKDSSLEAAVKNEIDSKITVVINNYLNDIAKPWDSRIDTFVADNDDDYIDGVLKDYANDNLSGDLNDYINEKLPDYIISAVDDYMNSSLTDADANAVIDDAVMSYVRKYLNKEHVEGGLEGIIEETVISYIRGYITGEIVATDDIRLYAESVKTEFIDYIKTMDVDGIKDYIVGYVKNSSNEAVIRDFVNTNYETIKDYIIANRISNKTVYNYIDKMIIDKASTIDESVINDYLDSNLDTLLDDDFISDYIDSRSDAELKDLVLTYADADTIADYIEKIKSDDAANGTNKLQEFIDSAIDMLDNMAVYNEFMDCFIKKLDSFPVNKDNVQFAKGVSDAIRNFAFDDIEKILRNKGYGTIIDIIGADNFRDIFAESQADYCSGLDAITAQVEADSTISTSYTTSMSVKLDALKILNDMFDKYKAKLIDKLRNNAPYYYENNVDLRNFAEDVEFTDLLDYDATKVDELHSGYSVKPFMDYYDFTLEKLIALDKALLYYGDLTDDEYRVFKHELSEDIAKVINRFDQMIKDIENDDEIAKGKTLDDVIAKINSLKSVADSLGDSALGAYKEQIKTVVDDVNNILRRMGDTGELPLGYTLDDLTKLSSKIREMTKNLSDEQYEQFNHDSADLIARACTKMSDIITELDKNGTIHGTSLDYLASKISFVDKFYKKYNDKIDYLVNKFANAVGDKKFDSSTIEKYLDSKRIEEILVGKDVKNDDIFNVDGAFNIIIPRIDGLKTDNPTESGKTFIDTYKKTTGENSLSISRYLN